MAEPRMVRAPDGEVYEVPAEATDAQISAYFKAIPAANAPNAPKAKTWTDLAVNAPSDSGALATATIPTAITQLATNPAVPKAAATFGRLVGAAAPIVGGGVTYGPGGAAVGVAGAAKGAWAGGKAGWFTGKLAQQAALPVAEALERLPMAAIAGAQGVGDLAQMAEPNRSDIGVLGMGATHSMAADRAAVMGAQIQALIKQGKSPGEAARTVYNAWAKALKEQP